MHIFTYRTVFAEEIHTVDFKIGQTQQGRDIIVEQWGDGENRILLVGCIHGTEDIGVRLINQTMFYLNKHPEWLDGKTVYMLPLLNSDGAVMGIRGNRENIDINRQFPTQNFGRGWFHGEKPLQSIEAEVLMSFILKVQPDRILVLHQPLDGIDFDGPAKELAQHLSDKTNIRIHRLGGRSGSMGTFFGRELGGSVVTLEIPESYNSASAQELWQKYGVFMELFIKYPNGVVESD